MPTRIPAPFAVPGPDGAARSGGPGDDDDDELPIGDPPDDDDGDWDDDDDEDDEDDDEDPLQALLRRSIANALASRHNGAPLRAVKGMKAGLARRLCRPLRCDVLRCLPVL